MMLGAIGNVVLAIFASIGALVVLFWVLDRLSRRAERKRQQRDLERFAREGQAPPPVLPAEDWARTMQGAGVAIRPVPVEPISGAPSAVPDLSLGTFAPISDDEVRRQAAGINLWSGIMFG